MIEALKQKVSDTALHTQLAYHGLHASRLERQMNDSEQAGNRLEHEAAFFQALGDVAVHVVLEEGKDNPNMPPQITPDETRHAFSGQAEYHSMSDVYGKYGVSSVDEAIADSRIPDHELPEFALEKRNKPEDRLDSDLEDPRNPGDIITAETQKEQAAKHKTMRRVNSIRDSRGRQVERRRMVGNTGPNRAIRTNYSHFIERQADIADYKSGKISASELKARQTKRNAHMMKSEWPALRIGAKSIEAQSAILIGELQTKADKASKKQSKAEAKKAKLEGKLAERKRKHDDIKSRV
jgi:hypothetical protein